MRLMMFKQHNFKKGRKKREEEKTNRCFFLLTINNWIKKGIKYEKDYRCVFLFLSRDWQSKAPSNSARKIKFGPFSRNATISKCNPNRISFANTIQSEYNVVTGLIRQCWMLLNYTWEIYLDENEVWLT